MSLVAYDSSSEEEEEEEEAPAAAEAVAAGEQERKLSDDRAADPLPPPPPPAPNPSSVASSYHLLSSVSSLPTPSLDQLPDAAVLLASTSIPSHRTIGTDHSSHVAAAIMANTSRKRESNGSVPQQGHGKYPRGQLLNLRNVETGSSMLIPPQLTGRSNVVTEDISKLFVSRRRESSSEE